MIETVPFCVDAEQEGLKENSKESVQIESPLASSEDRDDALDMINKVLETEKAKEVTLLKKRNFS